MLEAKNGFCTGWASQGECENNAAFMWGVGEGVPHTRPSKWLALFALCRKPASQCILVALFYTAS